MGMWGPLPWRAQTSSRADSGPQPLLGSPVEFLVEFLVESLAERE
jgi:hypothetical protein